MILCIGEVLGAAQLETIRAELDGARFLDGRATAGWAAQAVKNNHQLDAASAAFGRLTRLVLAALEANETLQTAALPRSMSALLFTRTGAGQGYGAHVDNAVMGAPPLRTDLAFTLFLADPASYEGGELVISGNEGEEPIKLPAGAMVLYPATSVHRVETVRSGTRLVCAGWIQSLVRDPRVREMLFDLSRVKRALFEREGKSEAFDLVSKTQSNLLRLYAEL